MTVMTKKWEKAAQNLRSQSGKNKTKNRAGVMTATDFAVDLNDLFNDLTNRQFQGIVDKCSTQIRKGAVRLLKQGSTADRIGRSQYNKRTRGDWRNPRVSETGKEYLKGGWHGDVLDKRGANKPSMAYNGGSATGRASSRGDKGIISKTIPQRNGGRRGIIGPRYSTDDKDNGKYGYNYAHVLEKGGNIAAYGNKSRRVSIQARPFMKPAGEKAGPKNKEIINKQLKDWGKGK